MVKECSILTVMLLIFSPYFFSSPMVGAAPAIGSTTVTLHTVADAYVNSSDPETNYGSADSLYVGASSELDFLYVMFDLSGIPTEANIISAELRLYLSSTGGEIFGYPADNIGSHYCPDSSWLEHEITWSNKPSFDPEPTDLWSFGIVYTTRAYKSWNVVADVRTALPTATLTEVLKFENKTGDGYAVFQSVEDANNPKLDVEYSTEPVFAVHIESLQDTGLTSNLGLATIADYTFSLPTDTDVVAGEYQIRYSGGYTFMRWETSDGVTVSDAEAANTTVTISGNGTLGAVGNVKRLEYTYDTEQPEWESQTAGRIDAVRFTPLFSDQLLMARFYIIDVSSYQSNAFMVHVMDENRDDLITPFEVTPTFEGWFDVDLSSHGIGVQKGRDFYIGMEWITNYTPVLGKDKTSPSGRSWHLYETGWQEETHSDFVIRAVVGSLIDHAIVADGTVFHVATESNSTVSDFQFSKEEKKLLLNVTGPTDSQGFCNVTIPDRLLGGPFNVTFDEQPLNETLSSDNGTHTWLHFRYPHSTHRIEIVGTTVIPEFPSTTILPILTIALIAAAFAKKIRRRAKAT